MASLADFMESVDSDSDKKILVDYSHLSHRNLFMAKANIDRASNNMLSIRSDISDYDLILKDGNEDKSAALVDMYYHQMLRSIIHIKKHFKVKAEDIVLCLDSRSWRKDAYKTYKSDRTKSRSESPIDWGGFYKANNKLIELLDSTTKIKILQVEPAEADDIIFTVARRLSEREIENITVTSDKDIKQILRFSHSKMYDPVKKEDVTVWHQTDLLTHILAGDSGDGVPSVKDGTIFHPDFIKHLKENQIFITSVKEATKLEVFESIYESYTGKKVFKAGLFATGKASKIVKDGNLRSFLKENELFKDHFIRNRRLIDMRKIPKQIVSDIEIAYDELPQKKNDMFELQDFLVKHKLRDIQKSISHLLN